MNPFPYAMFLFGKLQNCVKRQTDTCFPVQNKQGIGHFSDSVYKNRKCKTQNLKCKMEKDEGFLKICGIRCERTGEML